ncbi:hypothetical protein QE372_005082 [Agrobacterium pusense]|nr:hypothetical protein [Agrobacterium pusense]
MTCGSVSDGFLSLISGCPSAGSATHFSVAEGDTAYVKPAMFLRGDGMAGYTVLRPHALADGWG